MESVTYLFYSCWLYWIEVSLAGFDILVNSHADLAEDLIVDFIGLLICICVANHVHGIAHHILLDSHLLHLLREVLHHIRHLLWVHLRVHTLHDTCNILQVVRHGCIHLSRGELLLYNP